MGKAMLKRLPLYAISADQLHALAPDDLLATLEPLLRRASFRFIAGYEQEDLHQEFSLVAIRCQRSYNPASKIGHAGKRASFMQFVTTAINNRAIQLTDKGNRQSREAREVACLGCGWVKPV